MELRRSRCISFRCAARRNNDRAMPGGRVWQDSEAWLVSALQRTATAAQLRSLEMGRLCCYDARNTLAIGDPRHSCRGRSFFPANLPNAAASLADRSNDNLDRARHRRSLSNHILVRWTLSREG